MDILFAILFFGAPMFVALMNIVSLLINNQLYSPNGWFRFFEISAVLILPFFYLLATDSGLANDCCNNVVLFSPGHRLTIYSIIILCVIGYYVSSLRTTIYPPLIELFVNAILLLGIVLSLVIGIHIDDIVFGITGSLAIIFFSMIQLILNHRMLSDKEVLNELEVRTSIGRASLKLLKSPFLLKYPVLILFCLPILVLIAAVLYLFGQKPDSVIRAFTDTYKHGFSQLDYICDNVQCGGHYLCSVAANGHPAVVKPVRLGKRNGGTIICNRQLLISNAFEELLHERLPAAHRFIRRKYDRIGDTVHKYYAIFNNKFVSDVVYVLMKPAEWVFLVILYLSDKNPENRIAQQYLLQQERISIRNK
jgi:hypothetical protein